MIPYSYLPQQFSDAPAILEKIAAVVARGDFTLGREVAEFEAAFSKAVEGAHVVSCNSGTDALFLALKALNVVGGEVVTTSYSFYATAAAIVHAGATPVFVDTGLDFNIDPDKIEKAITSRTKAIVPVHWAGRPCDMTAIAAIAEAHGIPVVEDAAHAFGAAWDNRACGTWGAVGCFSMHPLKTLNVWGDGGVMVTHDADLAAKLKLMRNHGLVDRDTCGEWGWNSRLDTVQAVVASHVLAKIPQMVAMRRRNAMRLDALLAGCDGIDAAPMPNEAHATYYLYTFRARNRDALVKYLHAEGVDAKVHYPVPLPLQPAAQALGYKPGDFPVAEQCASETVSLPMHEFLSLDDLERMAAAVRGFYASDEQLAGGKAGRRRR